jgi:hypothetical protein
VKGHPFAADGRKGDNSMPTVHVRIETRRVIVTVTSSDGTVVVVVPKLG